MVIPALAGDWWYSDPDTMAIQQGGSDLRREYLVERRLADYLADHDGPINQQEQAELRARIRRDRAGDTS